MMPSVEVSTGQALRYRLKWDRSEALRKIAALGTCLILRTSEGLVKNTDAQVPSLDTWGRQVWGKAWESTF